MSLFAISLPYLREWIAAGVRRVKVVDDAPSPVPLNMAYDATLESLQLEVAKLRLRLHQTKQHNKAVTRQLLETSQRCTKAETEVARLAAEVDYWHARCVKLVREDEPLPQPPSQG